MKHGHKKGHRKHHRGGAYRIHNPDYKILAMAGAAGIVAAIGAAYLQANVSFFKTYWYALPLAFIAGGFGLLYLKMPTLGIALAGVGGLLGYTAYQQNQGAAAHGFTEAGRMGMRPDSGLYERQAGAILGDARNAMRAGQGAGAMMGPAARAMRRNNRAGAFSDAGGLNDAAGLNAA